MARGGYQKPSNPTPVSGPGALSRRTDGGPTQGSKYMAGGQYGEGKQLDELQKSAPMAAANKPSISGSRAAIGTANMAPIVPLTAPTQRPNEPLSAGMPFGAGPGPEALGMATQTANLSDSVARLIREDSTGQIAELYDYLISRGL